ncbi:MAG: hypothetical protein JXD19_12330 [Deltaproteobacteria bacterium]|nr:hypothetical protein [Deltaproteobacteria bacterium]
MAQYEKDKIAGIRKENEVICGDCLSLQDLERADQKDLIFKDQVNREKEMCFCSKCGKMLE